MLKKIIKPVLICLSLLGLYALAGFYLVPYGLTTKLPALITQHTKTPATLSGAKFNPFKLELVLNGFELKDTQQQSFIKFDSLLVDVGGIDSLKTLTLVVEQLQADKLQTRIALLKEGQFNFHALFPPDEPPKNEKEQAVIPVFLKQVQLHQGTLTWDDQRLSTPETEVFTPINLTLSNLNLKKESTAKLNLAMQLPESGNIDWQLDLTLKPLSSNGKIQLKNIKAERLWALFLQDLVNFKLPQGENDLSFSYDLAYPADKLQLTIKEGEFASRKLQLTTLDNPMPLVTLPETKISGIGFDWDKQIINIAVFETNSAHLVMASNANNDFNLQPFFVSKTTPSPPKPIKTPPKAVAASKPWIINIAKIGIHKLQAEYQRLEAKVPLQVRVASLDFDLLDTHLDFGATHSQIQNKAGKLNAQELDLRDFRLYESSPALQVKQELVQFESGLFQLDIDDHQPLQIITENGRLKAQNASLQVQDLKQALVRLPEVAISGAKFNLVKQQVDVAQLQAKDAQMSAWLAPDGQLNYLSLFTEKNANLKAPPAPVITKNTVVPAWSVTLADLDLQNFQFDVQDKTHAKPVGLQLSALNFKAQQLSNRPGQKLPFTLKTKINGKGSLDVKGQTVLAPLKADLQATLTDLELKTFQPYLNDYARVDIIDGGFNSTAKVAINKPNAKAELDLQVKGSLNIKELLTRDQLLNKDLVKWQAVKFDNIDFDLSPLKINVGNVLLQEPYARVTIKKDHTLNFADLMVKQPSPAVVSKPDKAVKTTPPQFKIAELRVAKGMSDFSDLSLIIPFSVQLNELNGGLNGFSSTQKQLASFNMTGKVFDLSSMEMSSKFNPDFSVLDVGMHFKGMPLPFVSPYMVEFAGYKIEKGKMSLDLEYKIADRKLDAQNKLVLDQLTLGDQVENPKATSLPLKLAIALLKDGDGKININLPVTGSLDDPKFSVSTLVFDAFVNILTKAISSPFKALGALVSEGGGDPSQVLFKEGSDAISEAEQAKLLQVAKALAEKPSLNVDIKGNAYTKEDWPALQDDALVDQLKVKKAAELSAKGKKQLAEYVELTPDDKQRLVADMYIKKFPKLAKRTLFGTPQLVNSDKDFNTVAKNQLESMIPPDNQRLSTLALMRARNIAQVLIQKGKITQDRIFILDSHVQAESTKEGIVSSLSLTVK